jgi:hypothetical protein
MWWCWVPSTRKLIAKPSRPYGFEMLGSLGVAQPHKHHNR